MAKKIRRPPRRENNAEFRRWSVPMQTLGGEMARSYARVMSLLNDGRFGDPAWERAIRRETARWSQMADELSRMTPPPVAQQTHETALAWFRASVDLGAALMTLIESGDPERAQEVDDGLQRVVALQDQARAAAATLTNRLRLASS